MLTEGSYWGFSGNIQVIEELPVLPLSLCSSVVSAWCIQLSQGFPAPAAAPLVLVQLHVSCASLH